MAKALKNLLSEYGYNLVALPKTDIVPLQLLYKAGDGVHAVNSMLNNIFPGGQAPDPEILADANATAITGSASATYGATVGISLLDKLLSSLNMGKASANIALNGDDEITISYENVVESKVDLLSLDGYLSGSPPSVEKFSSFRQKLEHSELYVISAVLKSNAFSLVVTNKDGQRVDVAASLKGVVDARVGFSHNNDNSITLKNTTELPVIFAFRAQQILYDKKKWWQFFRSDEVRFALNDLEDEVFRDEGDYPSTPLPATDDLADI